MSFSMRFKDSSFRTKMTLLSMASSVVALLVAAGALTALDWISQRRAIRHDVATLSELIGRNSTAAIVFNDPKSAHETLSGLKAQGAVLAAALYDKSGNLFESYRGEGFASDIPTHLSPPDAPDYKTHDLLTHSAPVLLEGERVGSILLIYDLRTLRARLWTDLVVIGLVLVISFLASLYFASKLKRLTSEPILHLAAIARQVSVERDYSFRATKTGHDELGVLIDDFNKMLEEIQKRAEQAEVAIRLRDEFISIAAHELRTPLTTLSLQTNSLFRMALKKDLRAIPTEQINKLKEGSDRQFERFSKLINDLLDVSRISSGMLTLELQESDLSRLVKEIADELMPEADRAGCELRLDLEPGIVGRWDRFRIAQVISNLILNAMKYGAGKPIDVQAFRREDRAVVSVRDFGIGIQKADQGRIFERFERAVSFKHFGGFGVGLFIARQNLDAHGGSIWVESEPGQGSRFIFELPLNPADSADRAA